MEHLKKLEAIKEYEALTSEEIQNEINAAAANVVYSLIEEIGKVTLESEEKILAAEEAYENLARGWKSIIDYPWRGISHIKIASISYYIRRNFFYG